MIVRESECTQNRNPRSGGSFHIDSGALVGVASSIALFLCGTPAGAQTDTHPIFKDRVFQSVIRGFMELTNGCESLQTRPDFLVKVYEQVPVSSRMRSSAKEVLAQFQCRGVKAEIMFRVRSGSEFVPDTFLGLVNASFGYEDFYGAISSRGDADAPADFNNLFLGQPLIGEIGDALASIAPEGCSWNLRNLVDDEAVVRDRTLMPSQRFDGSLECTDPSDTSCHPHYHFSGRYYLRKAYLVLDHIEFDIPCA